ncbi:tRNA (adenosine(37)-N6)-threonylcarbamoyltransferase complex ATPase subunit type 1 TsaE [bacterium]|nr:tRNA (adenosine(37)-N6)-threonylcarbamoyltransferase complex ATPase subunit type 1 TsaE [bacterium]MBU1990026.1 tRNA (adenosine(37)-N6)-threonylcarbamoyltransferase complex ATPase subunit type 1 TsaE [bacterium]
MKSYELKLSELHILIEDVAENFKNGVVILQGDLACGKTTFVKEMAKKLGYGADVTSPTFSLQHCYGDKIFHYDIYNHGLEHFISLGMLEELEKEGLHFVEWGSDELVAILTSAGIDTLTIKIEKISDDMRKYRVEYAYA